MGKVTSEVQESLYRAGGYMLMLTGATSAEVLTTKVKESWDKLSPETQSVVERIVQQRIESFFTGGGELGVFYMTISNAIEEVKKEAAHVHA